MSTTPRTTPAQSDSRRIADAILGPDVEIVFAEHLRAGDHVHVNGQARIIEAVLRGGGLALLYRAVADVRQAEREGVPVCELGMDEFYPHPDECFVRRVVR